MEEITGERTAQRNRDSAQASASAGQAIRYSPIGSAKNGSFPSLSYIISAVVTISYRKVHIRVAEVGREQKETEPEKESTQPPSPQPKPE